MGLKPASVHPSVLLVLFNTNISKTSRPIRIKFYLKHHWGRGKATEGFGPDPIRTLVSFGTSYNGDNLVSTLAPPFWIGSSSFLQVTRTTITSQTGSKFGKIQQETAELAALERLEKSPLTYNGRKVVSTLVSSFLYGSLSFLQVTRTAIKA